MRIDTYKYRLLVIVLLTFLNITNLSKECEKQKKGLTDEQLEFIKKDLVKPDNLSQEVSNEK